METNSKAVQGLFTLDNQEEFGFAVTQIQSHMDQKTHGTGADGLPLAQLSAWNLNEDTRKIVSYFSLST